MKKPLPEFFASHLRIMALLPVVGVGMGLSWVSGVRAEKAPEGVQQLLGRNGIPSIFEPKFVPAKEADIPDNAWILGVVMDGEAHAYSLNLLNHHEIVNDRIGSNSFAAVW